MKENETPTLTHPLGAQDPARRGLDRNTLDINHRVLLMAEHVPIFYPTTPPRTTQLRRLRAVEQLGSPLISPVRTSDEPE